MTTVTTRLLELSPMSRVEGAGAIRMKIEGDQVREIALDILEPPRFFEAFVRGRHFSEIPDLTARICGICPVAHQMTSAQALERALQIALPSQLVRLRRLMYCAEWLESHALHVFLLNLPDFLGFDSAIAMAAVHPELVSRGLRIKRAGSAVVELLGGRATHPVSIRVGGFSKTPERAQLEALRTELEWALEASLDAGTFLAGLDFPPFESEPEFVALRSSDYAIGHGVIATSRGEEFPVEQFEQLFGEEQVSHSTALHSIRSRDGRAYMVGPLARLAINLDRLTPAATDLAMRCGIRWPSANPFHGIIARAIEMVFACEESLAIIDGWSEPPVDHMPLETVAGSGCAATEAPRGLLYHRYSIGERGLIESARITPPTAQNLRRMEDDLHRLAAAHVHLEDAALGHLCERLVRTFDPCISCSTHAVRVEIDR
ncbi:MAG: Ni/Fe hydrogenase subunit alpha [Thermoanaerobaculia bacterium]